MSRSNAFNPQCKIITIFNHPCIWSLIWCFDFSQSSFETQGNNLSHCYCQFNFLQTQLSALGSEDEIEWGSSILIPLPSITKVLHLPPSEKWSNSGHEQSMKSMLGKSVDQTLTIDFLLVNWHRFVSINPWPISNPLGLSKAREPIRKKNTKMENHTHKKQSRKIRVSGVQMLSWEFTFSL